MADIRSTAAEIRRGKKRRRRKKKETTGQKYNGRAAIISKLALTFIPDSMNILNGISYLPSQLLFIKFNLLTNTFYDNNLTSMNSTK